MTYYFVDYENVHSDGIMDCTELEKGDVVCVIYTEQAKNITLDVIEKLSRSGVTLELDKAGTGAKNALDFQLSSYLGYMIAKHEGEDVRYVIISKDTGFDRLIDFWGERGVTITRAPGLSGKEKPAKKSRKTTAKKTQQKKAKDKQQESQIQQSDAEKQQKPQTEQSGAETYQELQQGDAENRQESQAQQSDVEKRQEIQTQQGDAENRQESQLQQSDAEKRQETAPTEQEAGKRTVRHRQKEELLSASREELLQYLAEEEYSDEILQIVNSFKTKQAINNGLSKMYRDNKKSSEIYKKLKPLMKEKKKS